MVPSTRSQRGGAPAAPAMLLAAALLALLALAYGQPVNDGYGPTPGGGDGYGTAPAPAPAAKPTRSKLCTKSLYDKNGKSLASEFEACARKVVAAWNDGFTKLSDPDAILAHYNSFMMPDSTGRITPIAAAGGGRIPEYLAILAFPSGLVSIFTPDNSTITPARYFVRRFIARPPLIVSTTDVVFTNQYTKKVANVTFEQWFRLDKATNRVSVADVDTLRYQEFMTYLGVADIVKAFPDLVLGQMKAAVCGTHTQYCTGNLKQYSDQADCEAYLTAIPLIDISTMQGNNTFCRFLHSTLLPHEPAIHCNHIGKNSATCRTIPYDSYYQDSRFNAPTFLMGGKF